MSDKLEIDDVIRATVKDAEEYISMVRKCFTPEQIAKIMGAMQQTLGYKVNKYYLGRGIANVQNKLDQAIRLSETSIDVRIRYEHREEIPKLQAVLVDLKKEDEALDFRMSDRGGNAKVRNKG